MKTAFRWYLFALSKVADFRGRAGIAEAWSFFAFEVLFLALFWLLDKFLVGFPVLAPLYAALTAIPAILLLIRRLHDCGFSGLWIFIAMIPPICFFLISWASDPMQPNAYGTTERLPENRQPDTEPIPESSDGIEYLEAVKPRGGSEKSERYFRSAENTSSKSASAEASDAAPVEMFKD